MMRYVEIDRASKQTARAYHEQASVSQYDVQHYSYWYACRISKLVIQSSISLYRKKYSDSQFHNLKIK